MRALVQKLIPQQVLCYCFSKEIITMARNDNHEDVGFLVDHIRYEVEPLLLLIYTLIYSYSQTNAFYQWCHSNLFY